MIHCTKCGHVVAYVDITAIYARAAALMDAHPELTHGQAARQAVELERAVEDAMAQEHEQEDKDNGGR
jgi:hypothetical protein